MPPTVKVCTDLTPELEDAFKYQTHVALDIEGVDLGRAGTISIVQLAPLPGAKSKGHATLNKRE